MSQKSLDTNQGRNKFFLGKFDFSKKKFVKIYVFSKLLKSSILYAQIIVPNLSEYTNTYFNCKSNFFGG